MDEHTCICRLGVRIITFASPTEAFINVLPSVRLAFGLLALLLYPDHHATVETLLGQNVHLLSHPVHPFGIFLTASPLDWLR